MVAEVQASANSAGVDRAHGEVGMTIDARLGTKVEMIDYPTAHVMIVETDAVTEIEMI